MGTLLTTACCGPLGVSGMLGLGRGLTTCRLRSMDRSSLSHCGASCSGWMLATVFVRFTTPLTTLLTLAMLDNVLLSSYDMELSSLGIVGKLAALAVCLILFICCSILKGVLGVLDASGVSGGKSELILGLMDSDPSPAPLMSPGVLLLDLFLFSSVSMWSSSLGDWVTAMVAEKKSFRVLCLAPVA